MADDEVQLQKMVEFKQILVTFTQIEESQYREVENEWKSEVMKLIEKKSDDDSVETEYDMRKIEEAIVQLKERLISNGEHSVDFKSENRFTKILFDPENVFFRRIYNTKRSINTYLDTIIAKLFEIAEIYWLKGDLVTAADWYDQFVAILGDVETLNDRLDKRFGKAENIEEEDGEAGPSNKKARKMEIDELQQKIRKLEGDEEAKYRLELAAEAEQRAITPIIVRNFLIFIGFLFIEKLESEEEMKKQMRKVGKKQGDDDRDLEFRFTWVKHTAPQMEKIRDVEMKTNVIRNEWETNRDQYHGILRVFRDIQKSYKSKKSLFIEGNSCIMAMSLLEKMSFWPVFKNPTQHIIDGQVDRTATSDQSHNDSVCMGNCSKKTIEDISKTYKLSTSSEAFETMSNFIENLEKMRQELLFDYSRLLPFFFRNLEPFKYSTVSSWQIISIQTFAQHTLFCDHKLFETSTICIDETIRKQEKTKLKCRICLVLHTLAHLKFAIGTGSFHGKEKMGAETTIHQFFSVILQIEQIKNSRIDGSKELGSFKLYLDRLHRTATNIQSSCALIVEHSSSIKNDALTTKLISMSYLRRVFKNKENLTDDQLQDFALNQRKKEFNSNKAKFDLSCSQLGYMTNLYENKKDWYKNDPCPICHLELEAFVNFPCGHNTCERCYRVIRKREPNNDWVRCVTCLKRHYFKCMTVARGEPSKNTNDEDGTTLTVKLEPGAEPSNKDDIEPAIPGVTLTVKLEATIKLMKKIMEENPENNKILLLTTYYFGTPIWNYLTRTLQKAKVPFVVGGSSVECKIVLYPFSVCGPEDLHHSQANHIIILDPPGSLLAFEREVKYYQRDVKVLYMIVENSIEVQLWELAKHGRRPRVGEIRQMLGIDKLNQP